MPPEFMGRDICPRCEGYGRTHKESPCPSCGGTGTHRVEPATGRIVVRMREDWMTEIRLPDEAEPIVLSPGDEVELTPSAAVVVHRNPPEHARPSVAASGDQQERPA